MLRGMFPSHGLSTVPDNQVHILDSHEYSVWSRRFKRPVGLPERHWHILPFSQTSVITVASFSRSVTVCVSASLCCTHTCFDTNCMLLYSQHLLSVRRCVRDEGCDSFRIISRQSCTVFRHRQCRFE